MTNMSGGPGRVAARSQERTGEGNQLEHSRVERRERQLVRPDKPAIWATDRHHIAPPPHR
ncbi:hypothetical protein J6590_009417 [Homalodisca vitripennis]|nr:hypothetical protein J6590_009417 [Homalodisca vitripennis]